MGRKTVADASGVLVFDYIEMPTTDRNTMKMVAEAMDKESLSKQLDQLVGV
jgi:hypothetical protein